MKTIANERWASSSKCVSNIKSQSLSFVSKGTKMKKVITILCMAIVMVVAYSNLTIAEDAPECLCGVDPDTGTCIPCPEE